MNEQHWINGFWFIVVIIVLIMIVIPKSAPIIGRFIGWIFVMLFRFIVWIFRVLGWVIIGIARGVNMPSFFSSNAQSVLGPEHRGKRIDPSGDYKDYRGTARAKDITPLMHASEIPCGRFVTPQGNLGRSVSLPMEYLQRGCLLVGPPGSGKTEGVILPWIRALLTNGASVVTIDVKGEMYDRLVSELSGQNIRLWYWGVGNTHSTSWNWMTSINDDRDVEAAVQSVLGRKNPQDNQPFFYERDCRWLRALIHIINVAYGREATPSMLYQHISNPSLINDLFLRIPTVRIYENDIADFMRMPPEDYSQAVSGLLNALHLFNAGEVRKITESNDIDLSDICNQPTLLIIGAPLADARRSEILSALMLSQMFNVVYRRFGKSNTSLFFIIDEAARLRERIPYEETLSIVRGAGVGVCLAVQDVAQFGNEQERSTILANCLTMMVLRGCSPESARSFAQRLGERHERVDGINVNKGFFDVLPDQSGHNVQMSSVPVLQPREIMYPPDACGQYCGLMHVSQVSAQPFIVNLAKRRN